MAVDHLARLRAVPLFSQLDDGARARVGPVLVALGLRLAFERR